MSTSSTLPRDPGEEQGSAELTPSVAQELLIDAGRVLASSLDYETTMQDAVRLFLPRLADWCVIYLREADSSVRAARLGHLDPAQLQGAHAMLARYPSEAALPRAPLHVMATGEADLVETIEDSTLMDMAQDSEHLETLRKARMKAAMTVPLSARGRIVGAISFVSAESGRTYGPADLVLAEELGRRVATAIDNAWLYSEAQAAIRARDDVLGVVAHDLRNPIGTIRMTAEFLSEVEVPEEKRRQHHGVIIRAADRMSRLIQDLLDVSSIEAGRLSITREPLEIPPLFKEVREMFAVHADAKLQTLQFDLPTGLPAIVGDRTRLLQVFGNLLGNAVKFTPEGGRISVSAEAVADAVRFAVADSGPGIAKEELPHVFDRFWQSKGSQGGGAGLGLAITKGIVEAHDGQVTVTSTPGIGTTFVFTLPAASSL